MEEFKRIYVDDVSTDYEVSITGKVRNIKTGYILKPYISHGYYRYIFRVNGKKVNLFMHRLIMEYFVPNPENLPFVNHINCNKLDNRVENLEWCTPADNVRHAYAHDLMNIPIGEDRYNNKYSEADVLKVIELLKTGEYTKSEIADIVGVPKSLVKAVKQKHNWNYLTKGLELSYKYTDHFTIYNSIDRAIINGVSRKEILRVLEERGLSKNAATHLYKRRKKKVENDESIVQCTVYIDEGIEIFSERSTTSRKA